MAHLIKTATEITLFGECNSDAVADHMRNIIGDFLTETGVDYDALCDEVMSEFCFECIDTLNELLAIAQDVVAEAFATTEEFAAMGLTC